MGINPRIVEETETTIIPRNVDETEKTISPRIVDETETTISPRTVDESETTVSPRSVDEIETTISPRSVDEIETTISSRTIEEFAQTPQNDLEILNLVEEKIADSSQDTTTLPSNDKPTTKDNSPDISIDGVFMEDAKPKKTPRVDTSNEVEME